jgi:cobalamin biosynthesis protein CobD/CbiB
MISTVSFTLAYALDWLLGDPGWLPHPVRWMGRTISSGEWLLRTLAKTPVVSFCRPAVDCVWLGLWVWQLVGAVLVARMESDIAVAVSVYLAASRRYAFVAG